MDIDILDIRFFKVGEIYADFHYGTAEDTPQVDLKKIIAGEDDDIIDQYDVVGSSVKLEKALGREPTEEEEYEDFLKWLKSHINLFHVTVTKSVYDYFHKLEISAAEGCIDKTDGMFKFYDMSDEDEKLNDEPSDCYTE